MPFARGLQRVEPLEPAGGGGCGIVHADPIHRTGHANPERRSQNRVRLAQFEPLGIFHRMNRQIARVHYQFIPGQTVEVKGHRPIQDPAVKIHL